MEATTGMSLGSKVGTRSERPAVPESIDLYSCPGLFEIKY